MKYQKRIILDYLGESSWNPDLGPRSSVWSGLQGGGGGASSVGGAGRLCAA